ncbi:MAG TPA: HEAT repeat domain-containing protein [Candidatus Paceibacterota bacterium]|nr:HEAT repeat domain-containing protein [Verrucomicrobiota bacterium]HRY46937.1 HEAT repeat domain-containing protein [Candidatus Paceibacterota bacterium]HSA02539.1 HEAT repeat domain-containing protein [Candidatus Paceibacterota bacterium]
MRPKVILATLLAAGVWIGILLRISNWERPIDGAIPPPPGASTPPGPTELDKPQTERTVQSSPNLVQSAIPAHTPNWSDPVREKEARHRMAELASLGMMDDAASRESIMAELKNPHQLVRKAALDAIIQFGDRSVLPRLQELAAQTTDAQERQDILEAVAYLKLPSLTEYLATRKARLSAKGVEDPSRPRLSRPKDPGPFLSPEPVQ